MDTISIFGVEGAMRNGNDGIGQEIKIFTGTIYKGKYKGVLNQLQRQKQTF